MRAQLLESDNRPRGKKGVSWRPAWGFKGPTVDKIGQILESAPEGAIVHACCGPSHIPGETIRVDLEHPSADLLIDIGDLDKHVQDAAVVFMDPPYAWTLPMRQKAASAGFRALKTGGLLVTHAPWLPRFPGANLESLDYRDDPGLNWPLPPVMLSVWRKITPCTKSRKEEMERRGKMMPDRPEPSMWDLVEDREPEGGAD